MPGLLTNACIWLFTMQDKQNVLTVCIKNYFIVLIKWKRNNLCEWKQCKLMYLALRINNYNVMFICFAFNIGFSSVDFFHLKNIGFYTLFFKQRTFWFIITLTFFQNIWMQVFWAKIACIYLQLGIQIHYFSPHGFN